MKAFVVEKVGEKEFISSIQDIPTPKCEENEVVIKVSYSSLNYKDDENGLSEINRRVDFNIIGE